MLCDICISYELHKHIHFSKSKQNLPIIWDGENQKCVYETVSDRVNFLGSIYLVNSSANVWTRHASARWRLNVSQTWSRLNAMLKRFLEWGENKVCIESKMLWACNIKKLHDKLKAKSRKEKKKYVWIIKIALHCHQYDLLSINKTRFTWAWHWNACFNCSPSKLFLVSQAMFNYHFSLHSTFSDFPRDFFLAG